MADGDFPALRSALGAVGIAASSWGEDVVDGRVFDKEKPVVLANVQVQSVASFGYLRFRNHLASRRRVG